MSTAQHLADLARGLQERGYRVTVVTSDRGYDDPQRRFACREQWNGIDVIRVAHAGLGKGAAWRRFVDAVTFLLVCAWRLLWMPRFDLVVALTSPPLLSVLAAAFVRLKGGRLCLWVMDLNPDEAVAAGWLTETSWLIRALDAVQRWPLRLAARVVVLDRYMRQRLVAKGTPAERVVVIPPWSHDDLVRYDPAGRRDFRERHGLGDKFVVMYAGNHSPCHPLETLLQAALRLAAHPRLYFSFVGGGSEWSRVQAFARAHGLTNVGCLPYQPIDRLAATLSAADLHAVVMGDGFVGIVHPCKVYNVLMVGTPLLYIGPRSSHVTDLVAELNGDGRARSARHGDVDGLVRALLAAERTPPPAEPAPIAQRFSQRVLLPQLVDALVGEG